ncbi:MULTISPECIES: molybdopterin converting factor subunit 1 [Tistrella]|uniref:Molybdopterin synthase catalytic subunit n=1 Tax=Tistrella arctica TaxID=3133430 RepID=A0ABU9YRN8_9PROT
MSLHVLYFAWMRARVGRADEDIAFSPAVATVAGLLDHLSTLSPGHEAALADRSAVRVAVNQDYAQGDAGLADGDEVAIFPPVTGGSGGDAGACAIEIRVQTGDFDVGAEYARAAGGDATGGIAIFVGQVRGRDGDQTIGAMTLEHYPGMTEREIRRVAEQAATRWPLAAIRIIHRVGRLQPGERIVLVIAASAHRAAAFDACAFLIDWLKTRAPFWKLEDTSEGPRWVAAKASDDAAAARWRDDHTRQA